MVYFVEWKNKRLLTTSRRQGEGGGGKNEVYVIFF
jgi:hypothetical protein